ncbi:efflux RND transporter periplasmic adaptor subunit [Chromobacterium amazonense]|uniref:Efflux RND transporter periplasmic adaptor subunit n=1 Tax=Chromobacterium amazonense TaxID=1382803 RepID=A0A2S9X6P5_9NEIS|nr:efflux RND transporter periplasmic adaptor subunit [Chromobacterium amazonense]MBM2883359.1 efflux RND transporter periplasmic adaptor subunit [Chromobacterium amazonense]MDE1712523.1 efflux RND transporter periplasmic adaptor subunit [Chromobacterium amazonense]MDQ4539283.1 efflux RND transporter periplasmic adaptor subunit [Chromobacterium amazonense]PRP71388.1 efflux transporter periplasmic adaptor subunit [Chromobacterium amazonense]
MTKRMLIMLGGVALLIVVLGVGFFLHIQKLIASSPKPGPQTVSTTVAKTAEWQPQLSSVGTLTAMQGVDISSEVAGQVRSLHFKSGQDVKAGDVLVQLNADSDQAQLRSLQAAAELAATTLKRDRAQLAIEGVSQAQVDADMADLKSKTALVAQQAALVAKKTIRAPFSGRLGITTVNPGQYLNPGDKIVTLQTIDPVYVDFNLPQRQIGKVRVGQPVKVKSDAFGDEVFHGKINAINPKIDPATRNVQIEATIANPKHKLLPGMFANTTIEVGSKQKHLTLPQTAITYNPYGSTVFIVKQGKNGLEAQQAFVTTGDTRGDQVAITAGLKEGQEVVTSGQLKLKTGTPVTVNNSVQPANSPNPTPQEH